MICDVSKKIDIRKLAKEVREIPDFLWFHGERISTTWSDTNFGGRRQWFLCPSCDRRCAIIYLKGNGPLWGCRVCMKGRYLTEHMSPGDRMLHKAFKVRESLGQLDGGIVAPFPAKPRGMRWATYKRIRDESAKLERELLQRATGV